MWKINEEEQEPRFTKEEIEEIKSFFGDRREKMFKKVLKAIFSNKKITHERSPFGCEVLFVIDDIVLASNRVEVDGYAFNKEYSKKLYEMAKYKWIYGENEL